MYNISKYHSSAFPFPDHFIDPKEKVKANWCKEYAEAVYSLYAQDRCAIPYSRRHEMIMNRLYADGNQPIEKYMDRYCPIDPVTGDRKGFANISWDIVSVAPKFKRVFLGLFDDIDLAVDISAIDPLSISEKDNHKWRTYAESELTRNGFLGALQEASGIAPIKKQVDIDFGNIEELEMYYDMAFKLKKEIQFQKAFKLAFHRSDWPQLKRRCLSDAFDNAIMAIKDELEPGTGKVKARYVDNINVIARYSRDPKFEKLDFCGEVVHYSISDLRQAAKGQIDEEHLKKIAQEFQNYSSNPSFYEWDYHEYYSGTSGSFTYDNYTIPVLDLEWFSYDVKVREFRKNKFGESRSYRKDFDHESKSSGNTVKKYNHKTVYRCKWIVGTEYIFDYGHQVDIPAKDNKTPKLSYHLYQEAGKSLMETIIPLVDSFQLNYLEFQNANSQAAPAGLAVNISTLKEVNIGDKTINPLEIMRIRKTTGDLLYKATVHASQLPTNTGKPVEAIEGGIGRYGDELIRNMEWAIMQIRSLIGINEAADASLPDADQPVTTSKMAYQQTLTSLRGFIAGITHIKESAAKNFYYRMKVIAKYGDIEGYYPELGKTGMQIIKIGKEMRAIELGFIMRMKASKEMIESIRQAAYAAMRPVAEGGSGMLMSDFLFLESQLDMGSIDYARAFLGYKEQKGIERGEAQKQADIQANAQVQQQSLALKGQQDTEKINAQLEASKQLETHKSALKQEEEDNKFLNLAALQDDKLDSAETIAEKKIAGDLKKARILEIAKKREEKKAGEEKKKTA